MAPRSRRLDACVALLLALAVALCWLPAPQVLADHAVDSGLKRALVSFATARTLHGVVSVVQGTELAVQPMGMGVTLTPGRLLTPINELTAQVADWMLWASVAFGLQKFLLGMGGSFWVSAAVSAVALLWLGLSLRGRGPPWLARLLTLLLFVRLVMPITILGSEQLFAHFLAQPYEESQLASDTASKQLQALQSETPPADTAEPAEDTGAENSLLDRIRQWGSSARDTATRPMEAAQARLGEIAAAVDQLVERLVTLIVVFALQTLVIPLLLAWALLQLFKGLVQPMSGAMPSA
ncbi:MAG: hypothetical protein OZ923_01710 [Comamonadaceae bacterium]|nr:hypothetical protein [Comamonadaceae bacterium]